MFLNKDRFPHFKVKKLLFFFSISLVFGCMEAHSCHENKNRWKVSYDKNKNGQGK